MRATDTMYYPLRGSVTVGSSIHGWRSPDGFAYPRLPKYYPSGVVQLGVLGVFSLKSLSFRCF